MARIPQVSIFDNTEVYDNLGDAKKCEYGDSNRKSNIMQLS